MAVNRQACAQTYQGSRNVPRYLPLPCYTLWLRMSAVAQGWRV
jgi:hypothetical protein